MADQSAKLIALNGDIKGARFNLEPGVNTVGRDPDCGIVVDQPSVSRAHARIELIDGRYRIMDLGSRNGITVNERRVPEARIESGMIIGIGDLRFRFETAPETRGAVASADAVEKRQQAQPVAVEDAAYEEQEPVRRGVMITVVTLTVIVVFIGLLAFFAITSAGDPEPDVLRLEPVKVMVNENRLILLEGRIRQGGQTVLVRPNVQSDSIRPADPTVAEAVKFEDNYLLIRGRAGGETNINMRTARGNMVSVRVIVRGRRSDPLEEYRVMPLGDAERQRLAERYVETGDRIHKNRPYQALQNYRIAEALMEPVTPKGTFYVELERKIVDTNSVIQEKYDEISTGIQRAYAQNDIDQALTLLLAIQELIPDENDPRHQKAQLHIINIVAQMDRR